MFFSTYAAHRNVDCIPSRVGWVKDHQSQNTPQSTDANTSLESRWGSI